VDISSLVELASQSNCTIALLPSVGDSALDAAPVLRVFGPGGPILEKKLRAALRFGRERVFTEDPKYSIRLLVDIAIKALSAAINDPTTAVQALDQIEDLLLRLGRCRLEIGNFRDPAGTSRFLMSFPDWDDFLGLAFDEIRFYGANSIQVMRRMKAVVNGLIAMLPEERQPALRRWQERLQFYGRPFFCGSGGPVRGFSGGPTRTWQLASQVRKTLASLDLDSLRVTLTVT